MNKLMVGGILLLLVVVVVGIVVYGLYSQKPKLESGGMTKASGVMVEDNKLSVDVGGKLSMVDLTIKINGGDIGGFEINKEAFNSEMLNRIEDDGSWHVVVGVMKSSAELPEGKVEVGRTIGVTGGTLEVVGRVTVPSGNESEQPREIEVGFSGGVSNE